MAGEILDDYDAFIKAKASTSIAVGFDPQDMGGDLFDFQQAIVAWACRRGRAAIFADTGLGKTAMQTEWARQVNEHTGGDVLIAAPLCVAQQTVEEAAKVEVARVLKAEHESDDRALFFNQPAANADFRYWSRMACWSLEEAIALSLGKDPKLVYGSSFSEAKDWQAIERSPFPAEYERRSELARRAHSMHQLFDPVQPADFLTWANYAFDSLPPALLAEVAVPIPTEAGVRELKARIAELESVLAERAGSANQTWPWGLHETELLRKLRAAADRFWVNYDESDASTAPTNDQVVAWLENQGVSTNISKAMATILRADGIAPGPRK